MSNFDKHVLAFSPTHIRLGPIQRIQNIRKIINFWFTFGRNWWVISFRDYLGLPDACSYDVIGRADRFGFQNFCSPGTNNPNALCPRQAKATGGKKMSTCPQALYFSQLRNFSKSTYFTIKVQLIIYQLIIPLSVFFPIQRPFTRVI